MAFAQIEGIRALRQIQTINDQVREEFLLRTRVLERIRGDLYLSGTYVRDYLLEPDPGAAEAIATASSKRAKTWMARCATTGGF
jgi:hypothetical protein